MNTSGNMALNITKATEYLKKQKKALEAQLTPQAAKSYTTLLGEIKALEREIASPEYENQLPAYQKQRTDARTLSQQKQSEKELLLEKAVKGRQVLDQNQFSNQQSIDDYSAQTQDLYNEYLDLERAAGKKSRKVMTVLPLILCILGLGVSGYLLLSGTEADLSASLGVPPVLLPVGSAGLGLVFGLIGALTALGTRRLKKELSLGSQALQETFRRHLGDSAISEEAMNAFTARMNDFKRLCTATETSEAAVQSLTREIAAEQGIDIDEEGFHTEMKKQKERARAERLKKNISGWSEDLFGSLNTEPTVFTGYETLNDTGVVVALSDEETLTDAIATDEQAKEDVLVVLDKTPFYAEMGGQVADHGVLTSADCSLRVLDVKKTPKGYYVHTCVLESGIVKVGDHLTAKVDKEYRMAVCRNHTATHLLQAALREVLGDHVHQAGSYQDGEITHFDFTHFSAVTAEELARVEKIVNDRIFDAMDVTVKEMPIDEAKKLGAMALFGEKYGKVVRVVDIEGWSTEFCGGTHVRNTAQIGCFKIVSESSVAAGIRRIEAVTGKNLLLRSNKQETMLHTVAAALKANNVAGLPARAEAVMAENKAMSKELDDMKAKIAASKVTSLFDDAEEVGGVKIASAYFTGTSGDTLRGMCDTVRDKAVNPVVAVLVGKAEDKITMAVTVNKMAQEKGLKAGVLVKEISAIAGGKGGGKPDFAMAGLKDENKIDEALAAVKGIVEKQLG